MSVMETPVNECTTAKICLQMQGSAVDDVGHVHIDWVPNEEWPDVGIDPLRGVISSVIQPYASSMRVGLFGKRVAVRLHGDTAEVKACLTERLEGMSYRSVDVVS